MSTERIIPQVLTGDDKELSEAIRDATFELMRRHEAGPQHQGQFCGMNRVGHIAWLAHCLGIGSAHQSKLMAVIGMYENDCPCGVPTLNDEHFLGHDSI